MEITPRDIVLYYARQKAGGFDADDPVQAKYLESKLRTLLARSRLEPESRLPKDQDFEMGDVFRSRADFDRNSRAYDAAQKISVTAGNISGHMQVVEQVRKTVEGFVGNDPDRVLSVMSAMQEDERFMLPQELRFEKGFEWKELLPAYKKRKELFEKSSDDLKRSSAAITEAMDGRVSYMSDIVRPWSDGSPYEKSVDVLYAFGNKETSDAVSALKNTGLETLQQSREDALNYYNKTAAREVPKLREYLQQNNFTHDDIAALGGDKGGKLKDFISDAGLDLASYESLDRAVEERQAAHGAAPKLSVDPSIGAFGVRLTFRNNAAFHLTPLLQTMGVDVVGESYIKSLNSNGHNPYVGTARDVDANGIVLPILHDDKWSRVEIDDLGMMFDSPVLAGKEGVEEVNRLLEIAHKLGMEPTAEPLVYAGVATDAREKYSKAVIGSEVFDGLSFEDTREAIYTPALELFDADRRVSDPIRGSDWHKDVIFRGTKHPDDRLVSGSKEGCAFATPEIGVATWYSGSLGLTQDATHYSDVLKDKNGNRYGFLHVYEADQTVERPGMDGFLERHLRGWKHQNVVIDAYENLVEKFGIKREGTSGLEVPLMPNDRKLETYLVKHTPQTPTASAPSVTKWSNVSPENQAAITRAIEMGLGPSYMNSRPLFERNFMAEKTRELDARYPNAPQGIIPATIIKDTPVPVTKPVLEIISSNDIGGGTPASPALPTLAAAFEAGVKPEAASDVMKVARSTHGGLVVDAVIGAGVGITTFAVTGDLKEAGKVTLETVVPYAEAGMKAAEGDRKGAIHSAMTETAGIAGAVAGASGGAIVGATVGSVVPFVGTAIGGLAGGIIGGIAGGMGAGFGADALLKEVPQVTDAVDSGLSIAQKFAARVKDGVTHSVTFVTGGAVFHERDDVPVTPKRDVAYGSHL